MDFYQLFEIAEIKAIQSAMEPSLASIWRKRCRDYSEMFHTPLHVVVNELDPSFVLQALYESKYPPSVANYELEELLEILYKIKDPLYSRMSQEETEELVDNVLNREIKRLSKKQRPTQEKIASDIKAADHKKKPKGGSMDFSQLDKLETKSETNKAGFDPQ